MIGMNLTSRDRLFFSQDLLPGGRHGYRPA